MSKLRQDVRRDQELLQNERGPEAYQGVPLGTVNMLMPGKSNKSDPGLAAKRSTSFVLG